MSDKRIDLTKHLGKTNTIDVEDIMNVLEELVDENDKIWTYIDCCMDWVKDMNLFCNILSSSSSRLRCENLISLLNEEQLNHFSRIVMSLKHIIQNEDFGEIRDATFNLTTPTKSRIEGAMKLISAITERKDANVETIAENLWELSTNLKKLSSLFYVCGLKKIDDELLIKIAINLARENELDQLIPLADSILKNSTVNLAKVSDF